jgi:hypothetical protein
LTMKAATTACSLQKATVDAQQAILWALPKLERDATIARAMLVTDADARLDAMETEANKMVNAQNLTRPAVHFLRQAKVGLDISVKAPLEVPEVNDAPLRTLVGYKAAMEEINQKALAHLAKQNSWDLALSGGVHKQVGQSTTDTPSVGPYAAFSLTYNLGRKATIAHIDKATTAYVAWKNDQVDDAVQQAILLKKQLGLMVDAQASQLAVLQAHAESIATDLRSIEGVDTSNALMFRNQLLADQVVLGVEIGDVQFRLSSMQAYLLKNF